MDMVQCRFANNCRYDEVPFCK